MEHDFDQRISHPRGGCDRRSELAFTFANAITYVQAALDRGLDIDAFAPRISFFFDTHNNFLEEIAKFRAARRMWAKTMRDRFGAKNPRSWMLRFHAQTAGSSLTAQQPDNNVIRVTIQALAAILGGAQSLHTNSKDEALAIPTADAARLALRTQQIIAHESGIINTVDPVGGSYAIETLTDQIEDEVAQYLEKSKLRAACCRRLRADGCRVRFTSRHINIRNRSKRKSASSLE